MSKLVVNKAVSDVQTKIETILALFDDIETYSIQLDTSITSAQWDGLGKTKCAAVCKLAEKYQDDIRFLFEQLQCHIQQLSDNMENFTETSSNMQQLKS